jgi:membrane protease YdiL (CAAX protease family)
MIAIKNALRTIFTFRWKPNLDVVAVLVSCVLVTASLYTAMKIVTPEVGGGMPYFFLYAGLTACLFGVGIPLGWMVLYRKRPIADLGITRKNLWISLGLQVVLSFFQYMATLAKTDLPSFNELIPLIAMTLAVAFFEALFWRGWVLQRLEEAFGLIPAILLGSALYAIYHVGYGMPRSEILFLFWIGVLYAVSFRLTGSIFILWPLYQPLGQLVTLVKDKLQLPLLASLGFIEALALMLVLVWLANKVYKKQLKKQFQPALGK